LYASEHVCADLNLLHMWPLKRTELWLEVSELYQPLGSQLAQDASGAILVEDQLHVAHGKTSEPFSHLVCDISRLAVTVSILGAVRAALSSGKPN
jgi:hypothetical protein